MTKKLQEEAELAVIVYSGAECPLVYAKLDPDTAGSSLKYEIKYQPAYSLLEVSLEPKESIVAEAGPWST